jgi:hypothetical protein
MYSREFYQDLLKLAQQDLSQAHLQQHFTTARSYVEAFGQIVNGQGTWSANKSQDTLVYNNGTVTGKKRWISGVDLCNWVVVPVKDNNNLLLAVIDKKDIVSTRILTQGMEGTATVHFTCNQTPAQILGKRDDRRVAFVDHAHRQGFITNHLGIAMAVFRDIDLYTKNVAMFDYMKNKTRLDLEVLNLLWTNEINNIGNQSWDRNNTVYAFSKKVVTQVAQLTTEITGSGLFEIDHPSHQRYRDILIYSTHMRNTATAIKDITTWVVNQ